MTCRKGETTGRMNERDFPNIVELPVPFGGFRDTSFAIDAFHQEHGLECKYGRERNDEGQWYVRYCFADPTVADAFRRSVRRRAADISGAIETIMTLRSSDVPIPRAARQPALRTKLTIPKTVVTAAATSM